MTARDIQDKFKAAGNPWYLAKSFDTSCPIGEFVDKSLIPDPHNIEIYCSGWNTINLIYKIHF
jgi:acylpyruvate hydrolase